MLRIARFCYEQLTQSRVLFEKIINSTHLQSLNRADGWCESLPNSVKLICLYLGLQEFHYRVIVLQYLCFSPLVAPAIIAPFAPTKLLCQPIIHLMLMTRCQLYCPSDIMPKDWCIDQARLIRAGMIQQHYMIYSGSNILRQDCPLGLGCLGPVYFHHPSKYQTLFTDCSFSSFTSKRQWQSPVSSETDYLNKHCLKTGAF